MGVKNVTGRKLVGLRWWHLCHSDPINGQEISDWHFESIEDERTLDPLDRSVFWLGLYLWAFIWTFFFVINIMTFTLSWLVFLVIAQTFAWANLVGYWKCSSSQKAKLAGFVQETAAKAIGFS